MSNKVGHTTHKGLPGELNADQTLKEAHKSYGRLKLSGYGDSVPVQECLKEPWWSAYREGLWGRRPNPPAPAGDVRPGANVSVPMGERLVAPTAAMPSNDGSSSDSGSLSQSSLSSSDSSPGPRQRVRRLAHRVISSDPEEVSDNTAEGVTSTTAPEFPALRVPSDASLTQAVTTSVFHRSQVETDEAAAAGALPIIVRTSRARDRLSCARRGRMSPATSPRGAQVRTSDGQSPFSRPVNPAESSRVDWTPRAGFDWAPIETESWEKFEEVAQQAAQGAAKKAVDYATDVMESLRTSIDDQITRQTEALRTARNNEEFRRPGQISINQSIFIGETQRHRDTVIRLYIIHIHTQA